MSRASRAFLALGITIVAIVAAAVYPWSARPDAWFGASFQYPWFHGCGSSIVKVYTFAHGANFGNYKT